MNLDKIKIKAKRNSYKTRQEILLSNVNEWKSFIGPFNISDISSSTFILLEIHILSYHRLDLDEHIVKNTADKIMPRITRALEHITNQTIGISAIGSRFMNVSAANEFDETARTTVSMVFSNGNRALVDM